MGFQDALYQQKIDYASDAAVEFADRSMEMISYYAIQASATLGARTWCLCQLRRLTMESRDLTNRFITETTRCPWSILRTRYESNHGWKALRTLIKQHGMRNSNVLAIAPTATISNICSVSQSIEPTYQNLFVKSNLSGEFTVVNPYLVTDLKQLGLWDNVMVNDLKYYDGSLQHIDRIPAEIKQRYATAFEVDPKWLVDAASRRQKWIDQAQSLNLYMAEPSGKKLDKMYRMAWIRGLKTTYYARTLGASDTEKSTVHTGTLNAVQLETNSIKACAIDDPDCEACQ